MRRLLASAVIIAMATLGISVIGTAPASAAGAVCPAFRSSGLKYQWSTVGSGFTCKTAKRALVKLIKERVDTSAGEVALKHGPKGLHCFATNDTNGRASEGLCYQGTVKFPKSGFSWYGS